MSAVVITMFALGLALLVGGADLLVRGASRLGLRLGISPLVIGLTIVAFGTSAPELAVSIQAGLAGQSDMAVGNIVGSNIFNTLMVLGLSALITPLLVPQQLIRFDLPLVIGLSALFWILAFDGRIGLFDGALLTAGIMSYTIYAVRKSHREGAAADQETDGTLGGLLARLPVQIALIVLGLALLIQGAAWMVESAVDMARALGVGEAEIGLTIVAAGTSFPELATSLVAAARGERDIAVGNVVGSSVFNLLAIAGLAAVITPGGLSVAPSILNFDLPVMTAVTFACAPIFAGKVIARWHGLLFIGYYLAYVSYLILAATAHAALPAYNGVMLGFVLPLTVVTLLVLWVRQRAVDINA